MANRSKRKILPIATGFFALTAFLLSSAVLVRSHLRVVHAAQITGAGVAAVKPGHVAFLPDPQTLAANKPGAVYLRFRVEPGFHINSHAPKSEMLIPTRLAVAMLPGDPEVTAVDFPEGTPFAFAFDPKEKLDVYQGDLVLTARLKPTPGTHTLKAELRYQACDQAACYPPKTLPIEQVYTAK